MRRVAVLLLLLAVAPILRANPRDEVLRLVPPDPTFCFLLQNLRDHAERLKDSPLVAHVAKSSLGKDFRGAPEWSQLEAINGFVRAQLGVGVEELRDDICGDALAIVYHAPPPGQPLQEKSLALVWVRKPKLLLDVIKRLDALEGVKETREKMHADRAYLHRVKEAGDEFYFVRGNVFGVSNREDVIQQVLALDAERPAVAAGVPAMTQRLRDLGAADALFVGYANPRGFDADMRERLRTIKGADHAFLSNLVRYWGAADGVAVHATLDRDLTVGVSVGVRPDSLPESAKAFLGAAGEPSPLLKAVPAEAILFASSRTDGVALAEMLGEFMTAENVANFKAVIDQHVAPVIGRDAVSRVASSLGPDWAFWVAPREGWFPEVMLAVRVRDADAEKRLLRALDFVASNVRVDYNRKHADQIDIDESEADGLRVKFLTGATFPPRVRPAFGIKNGYLLIGDSPESLGRFRAPEGTDKATTFPLARLSATALREFVGKNREELAKAVGGREKWDELMGAVAMIDQITLEQQHGPKVATLSLRLKAIEPLRK